MLPFLELCYPSLAPQELERIFAILTRKCVVETLLFVAVLDMVSRARSGVSAKIMLSLVRKDKRGKMQTEEMELLHDVVVELQMAGGNFRELQRYLAGEGFQLCFMHSCGSDCVPLANVDQWYASHEGEQLLRTTLDWSGSVAKKVSPKLIVEEALISADEFATVRRICENTKAALGYTGKAVAFLSV